jgi:hypothetical protein
MLSINLAHQRVMKEQDNGTLSVKLLEENTQIQNLDMPATVSKFQRNLKQN